MNRILSLLSLLVLLSNSLYAQSQLPSPEAPKLAKIPEVTSRVLKNGLRVFAIEDHSSPIVTVQLSIVTDDMSIQTNYPMGLPSFTAQLLDQGTKLRNATSIANSIESVGGIFSANAGYDRTDISATVLSNQSELGFNLVGDVAQNAIFPIEEIERKKTQLVAVLQANYSQPGFVASTALRKLVMSNTNYDNPLSGTPETIKTFTQEKILDFYKTYYVPDNAFLVVGGDINSQEIFSKAEKAFSLWKKSSPKPGGISIGRISKTRGVRLLVIDKPGSAQTEVRVGDQAIERKNLEYFPGILANNILGGSYSSRLGQEIRIKRGLSYGVYSQLNTYSNAGFYAINCATKTQSTKEVLDIILSEIKKLQASEIPSEELTTRKSFLGGKFVQGLQSNSDFVDQVSSFVYNKLDTKEISKYTENIEKVTTEQTQNFAKKIFNTDNVTIVLVGDVSVFGEDIRKAYGDFTLIKFSEFDPLHLELKNINK